VGECLTLDPGRFTTRKESRYPLNRRMCGPQIRSGFRKRKKYLSRSYRDISMKPGRPFFMTADSTLKLHYIKFRSENYVVEPHRNNVVEPLQITWLNLYK